MPLPKEKSNGQLMMSEFHPHAEYMRKAIAIAEKNLLSLHGGPFGACIVKDNQILAVAANSVLNEDATCHAEMNAIRLASAKLNTYDLSGCVIYSTTEPCPMCFSAIHWAKIERIVYGTSIADVQKLGFNELTISNQQMIETGGSPVKLTPHYLVDDCQHLLNQWQALSKPLAY